MLSMSGYLNKTSMFLNPYVLRLMLVIQDHYSRLPYGNLWGWEPQWVDQDLPEVWEKKL